MLLKFTNSVVEAIFEEIVRIYSSMHILIITPIFYPSTGGAAVYYELLIQGLFSCGMVNRVTVITERVPGLPNYEIRDPHGIEIIRLFPHRAGGQVNRMLQYFRYGIQNLMYAFVPLLVRKLLPDIILIHSSFHNYINFLTPVVRRISKIAPVISDVRDHQLPVDQLKQLDGYQAIIACSLNVLGHIGAREHLKRCAVYIPVVQEDLGLRKNVIVTLDKHGLSGVTYLLFAGLIKSGKGIELLLSTYDSLRSRGFTGQLVLVGLVKDTRLYERALTIPGIRCLGPVPREELLDLISVAQMVINLSGSEGFPRVSLEAITLGVRVITPKGIPEFERYSPDTVMCSSDPELVASQIETLLSKPIQNEYPIVQHGMESVLIQYEKLFNKISTEFVSGIDK